MNTRLLPKAMIRPTTSDRSINLSIVELDLIISPPAKRTYLHPFWSRPRARRRRSHRSVRHQEYWDAGTNQPGKAFTPFRELPTLTPWLRRQSPFYHNLLGHSPVSFRGRTGSDRAETKGEPGDKSSEIPKTFQGWPTGWLVRYFRKRMLARAEVLVGHDRLSIDYLDMQMKICEGEAHFHDRPSLDASSCSGKRNTETWDGEAEEKR